VSDQQANRFHVFTRQSPHTRVAILPVSTNQSGSEVTNVAFGDLYPKGFFVAMSDNRTFQIYRWEQLEAMISRARK
jgi:myo-inositol-hexaphosphate 3-phosphohydrolase